MVCKDKRIINKSLIVSFTGKTVGFIDQTDRLHKYMYTISGSTNSLTRLYNVYECYL